MVGIRKIGINTRVFGAGGGGADYPAILDDGNTVAWFDSSENITKDGADLVSVWGDKSGLSHHLLQATETNQPLWSTDGVLFNGVDNVMKCAAFTLIQPEFIYIVFKQITWTSGERIFDGHATNSSMLYQITASPIIKIYAGGTQLQSLSLALNTFGIVRCLFNGSSSKIIVNETTPATGNTGASGAGGFTLGALGDADDQFSHIQVKEVIIRKIADTASNEAEIYAYLADKYSIL